MGMYVCKCSNINNSKRNSSDRRESELVVHGNPNVIVLYSNTPTLLQLGKYTII